MGGGRGGPKRGRTQRKHFRQNRDNVWKKSRPDPSSTSDNPNWVPFITDNPGFEEYYKEQGIVAEDEWEEFMNVLKKPLPAAFRINSTGQFAEDVRTQLESEFMKSCESEPVDGNVEKANGNSEPGISPLPWYPEKFAWQVNYSRMQLRKNQTLERFHEFLKQENEIGNITRQEAVSMVPPLFLDVKSNHAILDMCAAPGSKTFQLLEMIHKSVKQGSLPQGLVIANDVDFRRCNLLIHQTKRMCSANLIVTNHEAQFYPSCHVKNPVFQKSDSIICGLAQEDFGSVEALGKLDNRELLFDRVLCDVPCSGDGTLRKAPDIWRKWNCGMGNGLHRLQVQIAMRGISLLKVGGRLVYSTCSINPVEDEAVVAELLRRCGGSVELLDVSAELPELIRHPGLKTWKVRDRGVWLRSYKESPSYRKGSVVPSMFPSGESWDSEKETVGQELEKPAVPNSTSYAEPVVDDCSNAGVKDCHSSGPGKASEHTENSCLLSDDSKNIQQNKSLCPELMNVDINTKEVSSLPLERCMRILPHDQNGGAFFIAVLQKTFPLKGDVQHQEKHSSCEDVKVELEAIAEEASEQMSVSPRTELSNDHVDLAVENPVEGPLGDEEEDVITSEAGFTDTCLEDNELEQECDNRPEKTVDGKDKKGKLQIQGKWKGVDPVLFLMDDATINSIIAFYGINESFPLRGHLVTRNDDVDHVKRIYYVSKSVQDILRLNFLVGYQLKITSVGLKMFERQTSREPSSPCSFRISSEGLPLLLPYMTKQVVDAPIVDFQNLLKYRTVKFSDISSADFEEKASKLSSGCCIVILDNGNSKSDAVIVDDSTIAIGCWKGRTNLSVMVSELECKELLERLCVRFSKCEETTAEEDNSQGVS